VKGCMLPHMLLSLFNDICAASLDAPFLNCASIFFYLFILLFIFFIDPMFAAFFLFSFILFYFKNGMFISKICLI